MGNGAGEKGNNELLLCFKRYKSVIAPPPVNLRFELFKVLNLKKTGKGNTVMP